MDVNSALNTIFELLKKTSIPLNPFPVIHLLIIFVIINVFLFIILAFTTFKRRNKASRDQLSCRVAFFMWAILVMPIVIEWCLLVGMLRAVIGEETPDAFLIFESGHWTKSLKNPYYDLLNVHAFYMVLFTLLGAPSVENIFSDLPFSIAIGLFLVVALRTLTRRFTGISYTSFVLLFLTLAAVPVVHLFSWSLAAPVTLALFATNFVTYRGDRTKWIVFALLYIGALLFHGSAMLIILLPIFYIIIHGFFGNTDVRNYVNILVLTIIISSIMAVVRFFYTTAYLGAGTYWYELLRFLTHGLQAATREPHWSAPQIPRITSYSFTVLPAIALTPLLLYILSKIYKRIVWHIDSHYVAHLLTGGAMLLMGMVASTFSNSLSRELGYPGFIVITISAAYMLKRVEENSVLRAVFALVAITAYALSLFTPSINPWLYLPSIPMPSYTPTTYESYLVAEAITSRYASGSLYVESVYSVPVWYSALTRGITVLQTSSQAGSLIFSSNIADVWWS